MRYFPLFADLRGRRVLVVGGGEVAERKVRLLLRGRCARRTGRSRIVAADLATWAAAASTVRRRDGAGSVSLARARVRRSQLDGATLVVAATNDAAVNERVAAAARARHVLVNVVDDAERSSFIVPAIVDRSPLVIAISSGGVAPVLARLVRERLETLLDESLGDAGGPARSAGASASSARFPDLGADGASTSGWCAAGSREPAAPPAGRGRARSSSDCCVAPAHAGAAPSCWSGAGPGDPGLLTLNALRALQEADVILHDRLVSDEVLALARRDAQRIAGRQGRPRALRAAGAIHELMLEHARAGRRVVRLKGGDPFVFGRGGEELEFLREPRHPVRGGAGHHRGARLRRVRGRAAHAPRSRAVAAARHRALRRLARHARLGVARPGAPDARVLHGRGGARRRSASGCCGTGATPATPVAIVENGSRPEQRVTLATLDELEDLALRGDIQSPALLVVGEVAALAARLHWFGDAAAPLGGAAPVA